MFVDLYNENGDVVKVELRTEYKYNGNKPTETIVEIHNGIDYYFDTSYCHPKDNPNKAYGRRNALKKLLNSYDNPLLNDKNNRRILYEALIPKLVFANKQNRKQEDSCDVELMDSNSKTLPFLGTMFWSLFFITLIVLRYFGVWG